MSTTAAIPRSTLGLPVYNGERYLAASLDALLAQTFTDFELIISDNGSTDRTAEIARPLCRRLIPGCGTSITRKTAARRSITTS